MTPATTEQTSSVTWRFRLLVCCLVLTAVAFSQEPGRLLSDTKLDLILDPGAMLGRALHLWDPDGGFGQVQNQAYGYLFPMGPFFWAGDLLSVPAWATQRLWWSLLLVVAFLGVVKLSGVLGLGSPSSRIVAGFAYALSPRILTTLGPISIEAWPSALAPWVLVPLVLGSRKGPAWRAAALSALVVAAVGGVNAAATFAVIPLGVVWLLTREPGRRRRALMTWWPVFVLLSTLWWLVPLVLLGRYSPPFLDYIENASVTTFPTTLFDTLRGTSHWVPYVDRTWQAGNDLVSTGYVALNSAVLLVLGIVGLCLRSNRHRQFLVLSVLLGVALVSLGHQGVLEGWFAGFERSLLDGLLAPLRNVHKLDPVIRLPLVLGIAHVLSVAGVRSSTGVPSGGWRPRGTAFDGDRVAHVGLVVLSVVAVAGAATPALTGRLAPAGSFESIPGYWHRAVEFLEQDVHDTGEGTTALLVPGSSFATYDWGYPEDEPVQALGAPGWALRNAIPLAPPGNIRMLDAVEERLWTGQPSAGLAGYLRRAGIGRVVVRNDLQDTGDIPDAVLVHQALQGSPGIRKVADFGPKVRRPVRFEGRKESRLRVVAEDGWQATYRAVEIYEVSGARRAVVTTSPPVVVGGPESLLDLLDAGLLGEAPAVLATDAGRERSGGGLLLTDGLRRREVNFARIHGGRSATLTGDDQGRRGAPAREYTVGDDRWETRAEIIGARSVDASSSRAFADSTGEVQPAAHPFAAFDDRADTAWQSAESDGGTPWVGVDLDGPRDLREVSVLGGEDARAQEVRAVTDQGASRAVTVPPGTATTIPLPPGETSMLRVEAAPSARSQQLSIAEVRIEGLNVDRTLVLPAVPRRWGAPDAILLASTPTRDACVAVGDDVRCGPDRGSSDEEGGVLDRTVRIGVAADYSVSGVVRPVQGDALNGLVQRGQFVNVDASSTAIDDPRASAVAAIDGRIGTTWTAEADDPDPTLSLSWLGEREVRGIRMALDDQAAAARPLRVALVHPGGRQVVRLDRSGAARVKPFRTSQLDLRVIDHRRTVSRLGDGTSERRGVGVSEVRLDGVGLLPIQLSDVSVDIGCGFGPTLRVNDQFYATSVTASARQLFDNEPVPARTCGPGTVQVAAGRTRVVAAPAPAFRPDRVVMTTQAASETAATAPAKLSSESPVERRLEFRSLAEPGLAVVRENQNAGWRAVLPSGDAARGATADGWQQAWHVPAGENTVELDYVPDGLYRSALALGAGALVLIALAVTLLKTSSRQPPLRARRLPPWFMAVAGGLALGLAGGWWAVAVGALGAAASMLARRWFSAERVAWAAGLPLVSAACVYWLRPLGAEDGWAGALLAPQLFVAFTLGALAAADLDQGGGRSRSRMKGRSTAR
jgi:arabinofuranan 3-O-arabinosyltransferase